MRSIANAYQWPVMQTKMLRTLTDIECDALVGTYQAKTTRIVIIKNTDPGITLKSSTQSFKLLPLVDGQFTIAGSEDRFRLLFETSTAGDVTGFRLMQNGSTVNAIFEKVKN